MKILIKKALIICAHSSFNNKTMDILVSDGNIANISENIDSDSETEVWEFNNSHVSIGWLDFSLHLKDPGTEWLETLDSMQSAALAGGFTEVVGFPNTHPVIQTKESMGYFKNFSDRNLLQIHNFAAITKNCEGNDFTDMMDLHHHGALGFSDGNHALQNADILLKSLQYLHALNTLLVTKPEDKYLSMFGQMHEGLQSTLLGLKGIPSASEEIMIMRDLKLLKYANLSSETPILHFSTISTAESVELIRKAKADGLPVSCDISANQLAFLDTDLAGFDTNLKSKPPYRAASDREALKAGLADGTIDTICTDHNPLNEELKNLEFDLADFGAIGLQTAFGAINTHSELELSTLIEKLTVSNRKLLRQSLPTIEVGQKANLTVFDPTLNYVFKEKDIVSLSKNSPFIEKELKGKALGVLNNKLAFKSK